MKIKRPSEGQSLPNADTDYRRMRQAIDTSGEVIFMTDRHGIITFVNREFETLYGYRFDEVVGRTTPRILSSGATHPETYEAFWKTLLSGKVARADFVNRAKDGTLIHIEGSANPIRDERQEITGFLAVQRDVSDRKETDRNLRASEARYRTLAETACDQIFIIGKDLRIEYANAAVRAAFQMEPSGMVGKRVRDCFPPDLGEQIEGEVEQILASGTPLYFEREMSFPRSTTWQSVWLAPIVNDNGGVTSVMGIARDITDRRRLAGVLERQNQLLSAIVDHSPVGIAVLSGASFVCDSANPSLQRFVGGRPITGLRFEELWPGKSADLIQMFEAVLTTGRSGECVEVQLEEQTSADGGVRTSMAVTATVLQSSATPNSILAIFVDTTSLKALEAQFFQAQKMEAIGRLAGGIAHDFNNLLTSILGYAELLRDTLDDRDPRREDLAEIRRAGESAATLTRHLLAFSRKQIAQPTILDLNGTIVQFQKILRRTIGEDVEVRLHLDPQARRVKMDAGQLEQILMNLSVNARDAMANGGQLSIQTENLRLLTRAHALKCWIPAGTYTTLTITDTGAGIPLDVQTHLFEPFFTTKEFGKGTGLGLSTVYGIVKQNDGYITVTSEVGVGTTFTIYLPSVESEVVLKDGPDIAPLPRGRETVLIAEDNEGLRVLAMRTLRDCGYTTLAARDAAEALTLSRAHAERIDVLLTDVVMPGIDGLGLASQMAAERPETRILYMSGHTEDVISHHGLLEGGVHFLQKPFNRDRLARKVREVLDAPPAA